MGKIFVYGAGGKMGSNYSSKLDQLGAEVYAADRSGSAVEIYRNKFPNAVILAMENGKVVLPPDHGIKQAVVATSTPSHRDNIIQLIEKENILDVFSEKPLGLTLEEVMQIYEVARRKGANISIGHIIRFAPTLGLLKDKMLKEDLVLVEGDAIWQKGRWGIQPPDGRVIPEDKLEKRPTPGDQDEAVHPTDVIYMLVALNQKIDGALISGRHGYTPFVNPESQSKARELDSSFPELPISDTDADIGIITDITEIPVKIRSSFVASSEARVVKVKLSPRKAPDTPIYEVKLNFDLRLPDGVKDAIEIIDLRDGSVLERSFKNDKLLEQTAAFYNGKKDNRIATLEDGLVIAKIVDAIMRSHEGDGNEIEVKFR